ncbi:MAG TPA: hypothetical protein VHS34_09860 [Terriglobales bacterium]|nr:hypothetical protein [Terriglobales bacterium]
MPSFCSHEFLWPQRSADGGYSQTCRLCGAEYQYDWNTMRRLEKRDESEKVPRGVLQAPSASVRPQSNPRLKLLLETEPAYRVFFRNLVDLLHDAPVPTAGSSQPTPFWRDVFIESRMEWRWFVESMLCHVITIALVVIVCQLWPLPEPSLQRKIFDQSYISYYRPSETFPALRSGRPRPRPASRKTAGSAHHQGLAHQDSAHRDSAHQGSAQQEAARQTIRVPAAHAEGNAKLPSIKLGAPARPDFVASNPALPAVPLAATGRSRLIAPGESTSVVAPPPDVNGVKVNQAAARQLGLPQASIVAPPSEIGSMSSRPAMAALRAAAVAPLPDIQGSISSQGSISRIGDINIGHADVVGPAPRLPVEEQRAGSGMARSIFGGQGTSIVPPPPSVQRSEMIAGGRGSGMSGTGIQAVPPAPSVTGAGNSAGRGRGSSLSAAAGMQVVPPAPSAAGAGDAVGVGRGNTLSGANLQAVPPPPSLEGAGGSGGSGRGSSLSAGGLQGAPPASLGQGGGSSAGGEAMVTADSRHPDAAAASSESDNGNEPASEELPLRLIGLALALPNSSYFSNYEVFIAEKAISKVGSQLIKLVYVSLPYQRRLSEYGLGPAKVFKLRVKRDSTCDESLMEMTWPETDPRPDSQHAADSPALSRKDRNDMLPCYRTTADDNRKELSRVH